MVENVQNESFFIIIIPDLSVLVNIQIIREQNLSELRESIYDLISNLFYQ